MNTNQLERVGEAWADNAEISVVVFKTPEGDYTTWWKIGVSIFEVKEDDLVSFFDLAEGAIGFIEEEKSNAS